MARIPHGPRWSNCPTWAIYRWLRKGGYVAFRLSINVPWKPHFLWSSPAGKYWWGYVPEKPRRGIACVIHSFGFRGHIKREKFGRRK